MSTPADQVNAPATAPLEYTDPQAATPQTEADETEKKQVADFDREWKTARAFDSPALNQIARDRRYAAGVKGADWAVNANLLGSYIDILVSFIYARNPKVSVRPAEQTGQAAQRDRQNLAKTLQIVISRLWVDGKLKKAMKKLVRSSFSVSCGWFKAVMLLDTETDPQIEHEIQDTRDSLERIRSLEDKILDPDTNEPVDRDVLMKQLELEIEGLESGVEIVVGKALAINFIPADQIQVALDIRDIDDYLEAGWVSDDSYVRKTEVAGKFPRLTPDDLKQATTYYQRAPTEYARYETVEGAAGGDIGIVGAPDPHGEASAYTTNEGASGMRGGIIGDSSGKPVEYVKVIEAWDKRDLHIKTWIQGVKRWAKEPFIPRFQTKRFYPYFYVDFFPVDGERWPQSLTFRLAKLQDEYAGTRSAFRITRQRSIPGTLFNATQIEKDDVDKIKKASQDEFIAVSPRDQDVELGKLFAQKPQPTIDAALFETAPIIGDMEKLSGVQEALQTSQTMQKTATQANIEQSGFASRSTSERDCVEDTLTEFAVYTAQLALQALLHDDVVKMAGPLAFWPEGMDPKDITSLLDVDIEAGSTGRPNAGAERDTWIQVLPIIQGFIEKIYAASQMGLPIAMAYVELFRETLARFDDRIDVERFLPGISTTAEPLPADPLLGGRGPNGLPLPALPGPGAPGAGPMPGGPGQPAQPGPGGETAATDPLAQAEESAQAVAA